MKTVNHHHNDAVNGTNTCTNPTITLRNGRTLVAYPKSDPSQSIQRNETCHPMLGSGRKMPATGKGDFSLENRKKQNTYNQENL